MIVFPNAKINIGLYVTEKRSDGYHNLETIFLPIPIYDALEVVPTDKEHSFLQVFGKDISGNNADNLVWRSYELLKQDFSSRMKPIGIYLNKAIPMGAGMGGGSADGTFALRLFNDFFKLELDDELLQKYALKLGSDCPFFVVNKPRLAYGRGEKLQNIDLNVDFTQYKLLLIHPHLHISTKDAFSFIIPRKAAFDLKEIGKLPVEIWKEFIVNDFETGFLNTFPEMADLKTLLYELGAVYVSMTGTGSTFYAIFPKEYSLTIPSELHRYPMQWCHEWTIKNI